MKANEKFAQFKRSTAEALNSLKPTAAKASALIDAESKKHGFNRASVSFRLSTEGIFTVV